MQNKTTEEIEILNKKQQKNNSIWETKQQEKIWETKSIKQTQYMENKTTEKQIIYGSPKTDKGIIDGKQNNPPK